MNFPKIHYDIVDQAVMISGLYRSGTTLLGKLLGSFKNAEYIFEPPMILHFDYLVEQGKIDTVLAAELLRTNFAEDYMLNFLHGRRYNMRPLDDSSVFHMKSYEDAVGRWVKINRMKDAIESFRQQNSRLIFKNAAKYAIIPVLMENYGNFRLVEIVRDLKSVLSSMLAKGWFSDQSIKGWEYGIWPFNERNKFKIPFVGDSSDIEDYASADERTRAIDFINAKMKRRFEMRKVIEQKDLHSIYEIKYEDMLVDARGVVTGIADFLGMETSLKTEELMKTVRKTKRAEDVDKILARLDKKLVDQFLAYNALLGYAG